MVCGVYPMIEYNMNGDLTMKITSKQVAKDLKISEATVSLALNNKPGVSEDTKQRVIDYIQKLKLQKKEEQRIGRKIKKLLYVKEKTFYDEEMTNILSASDMEILRVAQKSNINLTLAYISNKKEVVDTIEVSKYDGTEGLILGAAEMKEEEFIPFRDIPIPLVIVDNEFENMTSDSVTINNRQCIRLAMNHLFEMGHKDIIYFYNTRTMNIFLRRQKAYKEYIKEKHLTDSTMVQMGTKIEDIYENVMNYIKNNKKMPTSILCENYAISIGTIKALQDCGYKIPDDISIIGIDELPSYVLLDFDFTHIKILHGCKANQIVNKLVERMEYNPKEITQVLVNGEFIQGNSVKKVF